MIKGLRTYFPWAGIRSLAPLIEHKLFHNFPDIPVQVAGIAHPVRIRVHTSDLWALQQG